MDDIFYYLSKYSWKVISPDSLFVILLTLCLLLLLLRKTKKATILLGLLTSGILLLSMFSVGDWMLYPLESRFQHNPDLPEHVDGIIVLGGAIIPGRSVRWQQLETNQFHERLSSFIQLAKQYPQARLVFSGGNANLDESMPTQAQVAETYFIQSGISADRLIMENRARNTAENVTFSKQLVKPRSNETWLLITSAFHMPRAMGIFCRQNWKIIPYPVDHQVSRPKYSPSGYKLIEHANNLVMASHEWLGLLAYFLTGKTSQLFPAECSH